jgi:hypothetical protein
MHALRTTVNALCPVLQPVHGYEGVMTQGDIGLTSRALDHHVKLLWLTPALPCLASLLLLPPPALQSCSWAQ